MSIEQPLDPIGQNLLHNAIVSNQEVFINGAGSIKELCDALRERSAFYEGFDRKDVPTEPIVKEIETIAGLYEEGNIEGAKRELVLLDNTSGLQEKVQNLLNL